MEGPTAVTDPLTDGDGTTLVLATGCYIQFAGATATWRIARGGDMDPFSGIWLRYREVGGKVQVWPQSGSSHTDSFEATFGPGDNGPVTNDSITVSRV